MKIALVQYNPVWEDKKLNKEKILSLIANTDLRDVSILIFPEMTLTGFSMEASKLAEDINGESFNFFSLLAKKNKLHVFAGLIESEGSQDYNTLIHVNDTGLLVSKYRKIHPFSVSDENKYYSKGEEPVITRLDNVNIGLSICYDLRFPELYRIYGKKRTELIINIANWPVKRIEHWRTLLKARAIENQCYVAGVNRVGDDPLQEYNGYSSAFGPMGEEIVTLADSENIIIAEIDFEHVRTIREKLPFLNDIRLI